ncbi:MAG: 2-amino-4-hydroxy-6-hydroxymethyldihydropteridine diphosphokinase [Pirellulaceae bacterium]|nr:2-amino-4-hydroxy-6-hydroxymethyldihydropteridine diphosphokinase [Pirellulaceae bacterium]
MTPCLIALGSNQGDRLRILRQAVAGLRGHPQVEQLCCSRPVCSRPIGGPPGQGEFLNAAARFLTSLSPGELHQLLRRLELDAGRQSSQRWAARPLDLDLLLYGSLRLDEPELQVPHPRMAFRRFVLEPAAEVAADMLHPTTGWTIGRLLDHLNQPFPYTALGGAGCGPRVQLAGQLAAGTGLRWIHADEDDDQLAEACRQVAGPAAGVALEFLARRADLLRSAAWAHDGRAAISDFSFDLTLAIGRLNLPAAAQADWQRVWSGLRTQVVPARLLVCWHGPDAGPVDVPLEAEIQQVLRQWSEGPVLMLGRAAHEVAAQEIQAAIQAMESLVVPLTEGLV